MTQGRLADSPTLGLATESLWDSGWDRASRNLPDWFWADPGKAQPGGIAMQLPLSWESGPGSLGP